MKIDTLPLLLFAAGAFLAGCNSKESPRATATEAPQATAASTTATVTSAEKTSFAEVTALLDPGGSVYGYLSTARWLEGLSGKIGEGREMILSLPNMNASDRDRVSRVAETITAIVKQSGLESISGVGFSGIAIEPGFYRSKFVTHHYPGAGQGYLWTLLGTAPHPWDFADWLPTNTVWASSMDLDVPGVWKAIRAHARQSGIPEAEEGLNEFTAQVEKASGMKFDELLNSLGGHFGFAVTLDPDKLVSIPLPDGERIKIPDPRILIAMKVRDDRWFDWAKRASEENSQIVTGDDKELGLQMRTLPQPLPVPVELRPSLGRAGDYVWLTSHDQSLLQLAQVKAGRTPGIRTTAEFKKLTKNLPTQGNQFFFVADGFRAIPLAIQRAVMTTAQRQPGGPPLALIEKFLGAGGPLAGASVGSIGAQGWIGVSEGHQQPADALLAPALVAPVAVMAGMLLPALAQAKGKAQSIQCVNNLKQLGLAARIYALDHEEKFPPDIISMKDEIVSPKILFCSDDPQAVQGSELKWEAIRPGGISYEYLGAGKKEDAGDPSSILFRCRIHGHVCLMDGSVQQSPRRQP